jgi:hypothetical protein
MPGNERSGRKGLGAAMLADRCFVIVRRGADLMRARAAGIPDPDGEAGWIEEAHAFGMVAEMYAAKIAIARSLLDDEDATDACLRLVGHSVDRYGPLLRLAGAA